MTSTLRRLSRQKHSSLAVQTYWDALHFSRTGLMSLKQIEARVLAFAGDIPKREAIAAIRKGILAARRHTGQPPFNDELPI
jgi:hypothetical protein